jgi:glutamate racemase
MHTKDEYIAVFDSGVGGISVLKELIKQMPRERYLYFGDCANAPYGNRSTAAVRQLTLAAAAQLMKNYPIKALVVACNTATAAAIRQLREAYPQLVIIGIEPALKLAADRFPGGRIGVMATQVTLREEKFDSLLHRFDAGCSVEKIPAPGLVELIESGHLDDVHTEQLLQQILEPFVGKLDALVLGCTHYPFVSSVIRRILGDGVQLLDGGEGTARETRRRLAAANLLREEAPGSLTLTASGNEAAFVALAQSLLR